MATGPSRVRVNYPRECEEAVNNLVHLQLHASYVYLALAFNCDRDDVALKNFKHFFLRKSHGWKENAQKLLLMQNQRGGSVTFLDVPAPDLNVWSSGLQCMERAFHLERSLGQSLLSLHKLAAEKGDAHLGDFLNRHFMPQQAEDIKEMANYLTDLRRMKAPENGMAEYLLDKFTLNHSAKE